MLKESDRLFFENLIVDRASSGKTDAGIGTYKEKSLHNILKSFFCSNTDCHETAYKGYVADIMEDGYITEIQSSSLSGLRGKLDAFLAANGVRIVFPLVQKRHIVWIDPATGDASKSKRSVKPDNIYVLIRQLIYITEYLRDPLLTLTVVWVNADDYRLLDGRGKDRKIGATKLDLVPTELVDLKDLVFPDDLEGYIPDTLPEIFTREEFAKVTHLSGRALWATLKVFEEMRVIRKTEPDGRKHRYTRKRNK